MFGKVCRAWLNWKFVIFSNTFTCLSVAYCLHETWLTSVRDVLQARTWKSHWIMASGIEVMTKMCPYGSALVDYPPMVHYSRFCSLALRGFMSVNMAAMCSNLPLQPPLKSQSMTSGTPRRTLSPPKRSSHGRARWWVDRDCWLRRSWKCWRPRRQSPPSPRWSSWWFRERRWDHLA